MKNGVKVGVGGAGVEVAIGASGAGVGVSVSVGVEEGVAVSIGECATGGVSVGVSVGVSGTVVRVKVGVEVVVGVPVGVQVGRGDPSTLAADKDDAARLRLQTGGGRGFVPQEDQTSVEGLVGMPPKPLITHMRPSKTTLEWKRRGAKAGVVVAGDQFTPSAEYQTPEPWINHILLS
jgi:hypothetical protein